MSLANAPRAGLLRRLAALMYDLLVGLALYMMVGSLLFGGISLAVQAGLIPMNGHEHVIDVLRTTPWLQLTNELGKLFALAYFFVWSWSRSGQTLGMRAWRLRVQNTDGSLISYAQGWRRVLYAFAGLANISLLWDRNGVALHDRLSHSEVVLLTAEQNQQLLERSNLR
ncbi:MAG: RDD family protein [Ferrimonas sp.]